MQIIEGKIYKCDHCGKRQFRQCDMTIHERWCKLNPNNQHKCYEFCQHLVKTEVEYEGSSNGDEYIGKKTVFTCAVTEQKMYSFIAEKRKLPVIYEKDTIRMPLECDLYKSPNDNFEDWSDIFPTD